MAEKRTYEQVLLFGARIFNMKHLWVPSTEYQGKPTAKPNYLAGVIVPKTRGHWSEEPVFANMWAAMQKIHALTMGAGFPYQQVDWPIKDGDMPEPGRQQADWARGHWMLSGSSGDAIKVEIVQNGNPVPLVNRAVVKPGDVVSLGGAVAQKANDPKGIKLYVNSVLFMGPGEEIAVGNSVTGAELMQEAQRQGLQVAGFSPSPGGFGGGGAAPGGFTHGNAGGFAQPQGGAAQGGFASHQSGNPAPGSSFASPSNPQGGAPGGFTAPGGFQPQPGQPGSQTTTFPSNPAPASQFGGPQGQFTGHPGQTPFPGQR